MAITVTPLLTEIDNCDSDANWDNGGDQTDVKIEGLGAMGIKVSNTTSLVCKHDQGGVGGVDMSGEHFYVWFMCAGVLDTRPNGGLRIYAEDAAGNWIEWYVGGSDNYAGGWVRFAVDPNKAGDNVSGTYDPATHRYIGVRFKTIAKWSGGNPNCFWDWVAYGSGLKITSGVADGITWEDIYQDDLTNAYGVISKVAGVYFVLGELQFGDAAAGDIDFDDQNAIIVFSDTTYVASDLFVVTVQGNAAGTTNFVLGVKSGTQGISGCVIKSGGTVKFSVVATDTDIDKLGLYGCTFLDAGTIELPPNAANREALNCSFVACGQVIVDTCVVKFCFFISSDADAVLISDDPHYVTDCSFISCVNGVEIDTYGDGDYDFNNLLFSGCTFDVNNSCGSALTVTKVGTSNPGTYTGSLVTFAGSVTLKVTVVDKDNVAIENAQVAIYKISDDSQLMNEDTLATGIAEESYTGATPEDIYVRVRKSSPGNTRYVPTGTTGTIVAQTGYSVKITLEEDPYT